MNDGRLIDQLEAVRRARILILGDIMLDRYIYGTAARLSPEG